VFGEPQLQALEEQVDVSNQILAVAAAQLRGARAAVGVARAALVPTVTATPSVTGARQSLNRSGASSKPVDPYATHSDYLLPLAASYPRDVWRQMHRNVEASLARAQASAADLETARLSIDAMLATAYFTRHGLDAHNQLLDVTTAAFETALQLTINRSNQGVGSQVDVPQARTLPETTRAQTIDLGLQRAHFEHAMAILLGKPPAEFSTPPAPIAGQPPVIPPGLPSELLERRPDIAGAEWRMTAANEHIGIAQAAFYPTVTLASAIGLERTSLSTLFSWPSALRSFGASAAQTLFEGGRRRAVTEQAQAASDATVATYRQTVLRAFQGGEDHLAALRLLAEEALQQENAVKAVETSLLLAVNRSTAGVTTYLDVITAHSAAWTAELIALNLSTRRMVASVALILAAGRGLGGLINVMRLGALGETA
jgi:NodT family efflux transporter outer membrane factor (OMF) lipoprotein